MKTTILISLWLALTAVLSADAPNQPVLTRYTKLWTDSPFTTKPEAETGIPEENPLEDYALGGITKLADGYFAILINKKDPTKNETIVPGSPSDFQIVDVKWDRDKWKETVVTVRHGSNTGVVRFEDKLITVKTATPKKPQKPGGRPAIPQRPGSPHPTNSGGRKPRPRVVVPQQKR